MKIPKGGNQNSLIEEQTTQWPKEKVQKAKQRSTRHTQKSKDRVTQTSLKTGGELRIVVSYVYCKKVIDRILFLFISGFELQIVYGWA